jgi:hypothetical protein
MNLPGAERHLQGSPLEDRNCQFNAELTADRLLR